MSSLAAAISAGDFGLTDAPAANTPSANVPIATHTNKALIIPSCCGDSLVERPFDDSRYLRTEDATLDACCTVAMSRPIVFVSFVSTNTALFKTGALLKVALIALVALGVRHQYAEAPHTVGLLCSCR